ncbi:Bcuba4 [Botrytis cinerea B05.10]|uniref:Adenylyltransferase and sulfurtransferase uba4 n=1 Tax=Botryotinia fuckeliana (strain B05.10) TaxID=332648 RepID=A0A384J6Y7_BOTFB|nr:Bcuba4 [Botrytis cinerea B05.10]ATZ46468.1 Bcuba4 [Botrytis cinerea B05.10]
MNSAEEKASALRRQITDTETELASLKLQLLSIEGKDVDSKDLEVTEEGLVTHGESKWPMSLEEYKRYGRQMIVPDIGIQGQLRLRSTSVLLVGAGGLGCPAAAYIAGAGVGTIGIVDGDTVEESNLHRQVLHSTDRVGVNKAVSIAKYISGLNPNVKTNTFETHLTPQNAEDIVKDYDLVLDCTDHPTSRYLISDICVLLQKPLVSASALRTDGQLIILNNPALPPGDLSGGPCYRCVFPKPPPPEAVTSCGDGGIIGPVVGVMGVLQALEAIKLIASGKLATVGEKNETSSTPKTNPTTMLLFSTNGTSPFRNVRLKGRRSTCFACGEEPQLSLEQLKSGSMDYVLFCGMTHPVKLLSDEERVEAKDYEESIRKEEQDHLLIDVREKVQFDICNIEGSHNIPFSSFQGNRINEDRSLLTLTDGLSPKAPIYVVCRLGNDSQVVTKKMKEMGLDLRGDRYIGDIKGGLRSWKEQVDSSWPEY